MREYKRILHVIEAGRYSGPNSTISRLISALNSSYEFIVLSGKEDSDKFYHELEELGVKTEFRHLTRLRSGFTNILRYMFRFPLEIYLISVVIRRYRPDLVHVHTYLDIKALLVARFIGIPVVWHLHLDKPDKRFRAIYSLIARYFGTNFLSVSESTELGFDVLRYVKGERMVIQSSVDRNRFKPMKTGLGDGVITILSVGNYHPRKGFELVIDIAKKIEKYPDLHGVVEFKILGRVFEGSERYYNDLVDKVKNLRLTNVELLTDKGVVGLMQRADIFLLSSYAEASPFVVWEAAACGLPTVSTDVGDVKKFITSYGGGKIIDRKNISDIAKCLRDIIDDYDKFQQGSLDMAKQEFDIHVIASRYATYYDKLLKD